MAWKAFEDCGCFKPKSKKKVFMLYTLNNFVIIDKSNVWRHQSPRSITLPCPISVWAYVPMISYCSADSIHFVFWASVNWLCRVGKNMPECRLMGGFSCGKAFLQRFSLFTVSVNVLGYTFVASDFNTQASSRYQPYIPVSVSKLDVMSLWTFLFRQISFLQAF